MSRKEMFLFNNPINTFYLWLWHQTEKGNARIPRGTLQSPFNWLIFLISNNGFLKSFIYMCHPLDTMAYTTAFVTPVVEYWLEYEMGPPWEMDSKTHCLMLELMNDLYMGCLVLVLKGVLHFVKCFRLVVQAFFKRELVSPYGTEVAAVKQQNVISLGITKRAVTTRLLKVTKSTCWWKSLLFKKNKNPSHSSKDWTLINFTSARHWRKWPMIAAL